MGGLGQWRVHCTFLGQSYLDKTRVFTPRIMALSIVGLGFGMNLLVIAKVGAEGLGYTLAGIALTVLVGQILGRWLGAGRDITLLLISGTAICGGSAIAAVSAVIKAKAHDISVALGTVFLLNACALFLFPLIGHHFDLTGHQFGLWAALAIHDTSSVVGASMQFGQEALEVGATVKLARALWIVPMALVIGQLRSREAEAGKFKNSMVYFWICCRRGLDDLGSFTSTYRACH